MNKPVVVVGAPGFLGTKLVQALLASGREVTCITHPSLKGKLESSFPQHYNLNVIYENILAPLSKLVPAVKGAQTIFNCAGIQHPKHTREIYQVNTFGPINLLKAGIAAQVKNFIHISSSTVCGSNASATLDLVNFLTENSFSKGHTHYTKSKINGDKLLKKYADQGTRVIILLPAVFYGSPPSENLSQLMSMIKAGKRLPIIGQQGILRSYVDINTVVAAMLSAEINGQSGDCFLVSDKKPLTTWQFYTNLGLGLAKKIRILPLPLVCARVAEKLAWLSGKCNLHLKRLNVLGEFGRPHFVNPEKAEVILGLTLADSPEEGLQAMARDFSTR